MRKEWVHHQKPRDVWIIEAVLDGGTAAGVLSTVEIPLGIVAS